MGNADLLVTSGGGYTTQVAAGAASVQGDDAPSQGMYLVYNDAAKPLTHVPNASNPKIDRVIYRVLDSDEIGSGPDISLIEIVPGTPVAGASLTNPAHWPAVPSSAITLARVKVAAIGGAIVAGDIVDERPKNQGIKIHVANPTSPAPRINGATLIVNDVDFPEMTITADFGGNPIIVVCNAEFNTNSSGATVAMRIQEDGAVITQAERSETFRGSPDSLNMSLFHAYTPVAGSHVVKVRWAAALAGGFFVEATLLRRQFVIIEARLA